MGELIQNRIEKAIGALAVLCVLFVFTSTVSAIPKTNLPTPTPTPSITPTPTPTPTATPEPAPSVPTNVVPYSG